MAKKPKYKVVIAKGKHKGKKIPKDQLSPPLRNFYEISLKDVDALISTYQELNFKGRGRRNLGYITRSAVIMLSAAWEQFIEESLFTLALMHRELPSVSMLPKTTQKSLCDYVQTKDKNELRFLDLAGDGWKKELYSMVKQDIGGLHTPSCSQVDVLFKKYAGIEEISSAFRTKSAIDSFVKRRGEIAHAGSRASYVRISELNKYRELILKNVLKIETLLQVKRFEIANILEKHASKAGK